MNKYLILVSLLFVSETLSFYIEPSNIEDDVHKKSRLRRDYFDEKSCLARKLSNILYGIKINMKMYKSETTTRSRQITIYYVSYNITKLTPRFSAMINDNINSISSTNPMTGSTPSFTLVNDCDEDLPSSIQASSGRYINSAYDRGHLTNQLEWNMDKETSRATFHMINVAPQDPRTNQNAWRELEWQVNKYLQKSGGGLIITGVCNAVIDKITFTEGRNFNEFSIHVPKCYWKLVCFYDNDRNVIVNGYSVDNSKSTDQQIPKRKKDALTIKNQWDIMTEAGYPEYLSSTLRLWQEVRTALITNRDTTVIPTAAKCANAVSELEL